MEKVHAMVADVVGALSLAIVRKSAKRIELLNWAGILRTAAQMLEDKANGKSP